MEHQNNFKLLEQEDEERYKPTIDQIKSDLNGSMDLFRFIGQIIEIYVPRFFDMMVVTSGGGKLRTNAPHEQAPPSTGRDETGPKGPADLDRGLR